MNVIKRLEFELAYCDVTVKHFSHYATETRIAEWFRKCDEDKIIAVIITMPGLRGSCDFGVFSHIDVHHIISQIFTIFGSCIYERHRFSYQI